MSWERDLFISQGVGCSVNIWCYNLQKLACYFERKDPFLKRHSWKIIHQTSKLNGVLSLEIEGKELFCIIMPYIGFTILQIGKYKYGTYGKWVGWLRAHLKKPKANTNMVFVWFMGRLKAHLKNKRMYTNMEFVNVTKITWDWVRLWVHWNFGCLDMWYFQSH